MKDYIIGKTDKNNPAGKGYTIYRNSNEELVKAIKAVKPTPTDFKHGFHENVNIVKKLDDTQYLCLDGSGDYLVIKESELADSKGDNLLDDINNQFDVSEHILDSIGPLYTEDGYRRVEFSSYKKVLEKNKDHENIDNLLWIFKGWDSMDRVTSNHVGVQLNVGNDISLMNTINSDYSGSSMFCHFDKDGNIVNRDYNEDLTRYMGNEPKTKRDLIEEVIAAIPDVKYQNYGKKWFANDFMFTLEDIDEAANDFVRATTVFHLSHLQSKGDGKYGDRWSGVKKMPKSVVEVDKNHLLRVILPLVNETEFGEKVDLSEFIDIATTA